MVRARWFLVISNALFHGSVASPAGAPIVSASALPSAVLESEQAPASNEQFSITSAATLADSYIDGIPGAWSSDCYELGCVVYCKSADTVCQTAAQSSIDICTPIRGSYINVRDGATSAGSEWYNVTSTYGPPPGPSTTTVSSYTSFSTAQVDFTKLVDESVGFGHTTITPVYALGSPVPVESVTTIGDVQQTRTYLTAPLPDQCVYSMITSDPTDCGQCHVGGGTVDLYFWPPGTTSVSNAAISAAPLSMVIKGSTLFSPTAYIFLSTISARNSCGTVGQQYIGTLFAIDPAELSTQIHVGGKVAAYTYNGIDYRDLTGLPPAYEYQMQPSCYMFGCPTIYSTSFNPTLKVPPQVRSIDPAWADCALALEGLYDPPVALQPRAAAASPTQATEAKPTTASPSMTGRPVHSTTSRHNEPNPTAVPNASSDDEVDSTSTSVITTTVIASTRVVSIDYSGIANGSPSLQFSDGDTTSMTIDYDGPTGGGRPAAYDTSRASNTLLSPSPLSGGQGVVIEGQTLTPGDAITLGSGREKTTLSLRTEPTGATFLAYGTSVLTLLSSTSRSSEADFAPSQASNGDFVLDGTTLLPGQPITIGSGDDRTTLAITSLQSVPAIVVDGTLTQRLTHSPTLSSSGSLPVITRASHSTPPTTASGSSVATTVPGNAAAGIFSGSWLGLALAASAWVVWTSR